MTEQEKAYIAGIVDGEGTVSLHRKGDSKWAGPYFSPFVQIANTNFKLLEWLDPRIPVSHSHYIYDRNPGTQKRSWLIHVRGPYAVELLKEILPYLVVKRTQAELVIQYWLQAGTDNGKQWCRSRPMPEHLKGLRFSLYTQCRKLNRKGPAPTQPHI